MLLVLHTEGTWPAAEHHQPTWRRQHQHVLLGDQWKAHQHILLLQWQLGQRLPQASAAGVVTAGGQHQQTTGRNQKEVARSRWDAGTAVHVHLDLSCVTLPACSLGMALLLHGGDCLQGINQGRCGSDVRP